MKSGKTHYNNVGSLDWYWNELEVELKAFQVGFFDNKDDEDSYKNTRSALDEMLLIGKEAQGFKYNVYKKVQKGVELVALREEYFSKCKNHIPAINGTQSLAIAEIYYRYVDRFAKVEFDKLDILATKNTTVDITVRRRVAKEDAHNLKEAIEQARPESKKEKNQSAAVLNLPEEMKGKKTVESSEESEKEEAEVVLNSSPDIQATQNEIDALKKELKKYQTMTDKLQVYAENIFFAEKKKRKEVDKAFGTIDPDNKYLQVIRSKLNLYKKNKEQSFVEYVGNLVNEFVSNDAKLEGLRLRTQIDLMEKNDVQARASEGEIIGGSKEPTNEIIEKNNIASNGKEEIKKAEQKNFMIYWTELEEIIPDFLKKNESFLEDKTDNRDDEDAYKELRNVMEWIATASKKINAIPWLSLNGLKKKIEEAKKLNTLQTDNFRGSELPRIRGPKSLLLAKFYLEQLKGFGETKIFSATKNSAEFLGIEVGGLMAKVPGWEIDLTNLINQYEHQEKKVEVNGSQEANANKEDIGEKIKQLQGTIEQYKKDIREKLFSLEKQSRVQNSDKAGKARYVSLQNELLQLEGKLKKSEDKLENWKAIEKEMEEKQPMVEPEVVTSETLSSMRNQVAKLEKELVEYKEVQEKLKLLISDEVAIKEKSRVLKELRGIAHNHYLTGLKDDLSKCKKDEGNEFAEDCKGLLTKEIEKFAKAVKDAVAPIQLLKTNIQKEELKAKDEELKAKVEKEFDKGKVKESKEKAEIESDNKMKSYRIGAIAHIEKNVLRIGGEKPIPKDSDKYKAIVAICDSLIGCKSIGEMREKVLSIQPIVEEHGNRLKKGAVSRFFSEPKSAQAFRESFDDKGNLVAPGKGKSSRKT